MNGIEKTLRDTLAKLENPDVKTRKKLYDTTESILRKSLEQFALSRPDVITERLQDLKNIIIAIEQEYNRDIPAVVPAPNDASLTIPPVLPSVAPPVAKAPEVDAPTTRQAPTEPVMSQASVQWPQVNERSQVQEQSVPDITPERERALTNEQIKLDTDIPDVSDELKIQPPVTPNPIDAKPVDAKPVDPEPIDPKPISSKSADIKQARNDSREKRRRRGGILETIAGSIVSVILIIFLFGGIWVFSNSEYYQLFLDWRNGGSSVTTQEQVADKDFIPKPLKSDGDQSGNWVEVFDFQDIENVRGRGEVLVETIGDGSDAGVRITSVNSSEFGEAQVILDADKLQSLTSHKFAIALSVFVENPTQIYIKPLLKNGVGSDRRRFQLNGGLNNVMLEMDMRAVSNFDPVPHLAVNSDITGAGHSIELYDVRYQIIE